MSVGRKLLHSLFSDEGVEAVYYREQISSQSRELENYWNWAGHRFGEQQNDIVLLMSQVICEEPPSGE